MSAPFEADLCPNTGAPRMRLNFANGWSGSLVLRAAAPNECDFGMASLAAAPTGQWARGLTELGETEATADEAVDWLFDVAARSPVDIARHLAKSRPDFAGRCGALEELLCRALAALYEEAANIAESGSLCLRDAAGAPVLDSEGDTVPDVDSIDIADLDNESMDGLLSIIIDIEDDLGLECIPYRAPEWFDEVIRRIRAHREARS